jgi:hypothetical protein
LITFAAALHRRNATIGSELCNKTLTLLYKIIDSANGMALEKASSVQRV